MFLPTGSRRVSGEKANNKAFDECVVLDRGTFDPDAVFLDDIVDDDVLPNLSLKVDGLVEANDRDAEFELGPDAGPDVEEPPVPTEIPKPMLDPEQLEVYGWESSFWRKLRGYFGL